MTTAPKQRARLEFRIAPEQKGLIERAAAALGLTLTDYSIARLVERARDDIREHETTILSDRDRDVFLAILNADEDPNEATKRAVARYKARRAG